MSRHSLSPMADFEDIKRDSDELLRRRQSNKITHLRYLRKKSGFTLDGLSQATAISVSYLSRLEAGSRRLNTDLIRRLAKALNCDPAELLHEDFHDGRFMTSTDLSKHRRAEMLSRENTMPLYSIKKDESGSDKLTIAIAQVADWKVRPSELNGRDRCFALRAEEYFAPYFGKNSTLYLEPAVNLTPESTVVLLSCGEITIKKVWSVAPNSLQLCDMIDIEKMKRGELNINDKLMNVQNDSIDFIYKVVGHSEFTLD